MTLGGTSEPPVSLSLHHGSVSVDLVEILIA